MIHPKIYAQCSCFAVICAYLAQYNFIHTLQGYFTDDAAIIDTGTIIALKPENHYRRIWASASRTN